VKRLILLSIVLAVLLINLKGCTGKDSSINEETGKLDNSNVYVNDSSINDEIGELVNINVYVNDIKIDTPVHNDNTKLDYYGPYNLSDYVLLRPICESLGATFEVKDGCIEIKYHGEIYAIEKRLYNENIYWVIDDDIFVKFTAIRVAMNGSVKQDGRKGIYLYTRDYVRLDIPATLEECYKALDKELDFLTRQTIKYSKVEDLAIYHFGTGLWIRNNWIYPGNDRIDKVFRDAGIYHPDDMSYEIIKGYHYYLNGIQYEIGSKN